MNVVWRWKITALILAFPMDIKFQLKGEIGHPEMNRLTGVDYIHKVTLKLLPFNISLLN